MRCYACKKAETKPWKGKTTVRGIELDAVGEVCPKCGEVTIGFEETKRIFDEAAAIIVDRGIRTGAELKAIRKAAGLKAAELAELLDVEPETVSRWERGVVAIPRYAAFVVAELFERPRATRRRLEQLAADA